MTKTHFILSTAGHVDHGKTALIKALTNIECDTHKEEKERGITINLGFAHIDLAEDKSIGIIDVPGHKDFVNTMVAGANSTDIALLVVAADSGVMPQTEEHLNIMQMLNVKNGFVAITRTDLADKELTEIVEEEIKSLVEGTFLENCPIVKTSAKTGEGISDIKDTIEKLLLKTPERSCNDIFRLYIDRIFTVKGFGTVINGSALDGKLKISDDIYLLPKNAKLRIRRMERFGKEVETVYPGDRTSINVSGLNKSEFESGMLLSKRKLKSSTRIDAVIKFFDHKRNFGIWSDMLFLLGTYQEQIKVHLLNRKQIASGQKAFVQIHLKKPCVAKYGDRFILRSTSNDITLGGGAILNIDPLHHRRRNEEVINNLTLINKYGLEGMIYQILNRHRIALSYEQIGKLTNTSKHKVENILKQKKLDKIITAVFHDKNFAISKKIVEKIKKRILDLLNDFHKRNPISLRGLTMKELTGVLDEDIKKNKEETIRLIISRLLTKNRIRKIDNSFISADHEIELSQQEKKELQMINDYIKNLGYETFDEDEFYAKTGFDFPHVQLNNFLNRLMEEGYIISIQGNIMHMDNVEKGKKAMVNYLLNNEDGIEISTFRDLINSSRRIALLICSYCDDKKITVRRGDKRFLTEKCKNKY